MRRVLPPSLLLAAITLAPSCRDVADIEEHPVCEERVSTKAACQSCTRAECCDRAALCLADAECSAANRCVDACASAQCRAACARDHGLGHTLARLMSCQAARCADECGMTCGGYVFDSKVCGECVEKACCGEAEACSKNGDCLALAFCEKACQQNDHACRSECELRYPSALDSARALSGCAAEKCREACDYALVAPDWSCVEEPLPADSGSDQVAISVSVVPNAPMPDEVDVPGASVKACQKLLPGVQGYACHELTSPATTDLTGKATLAGFPSSAAYFEVSGGILPVGGVQSFLYYPEPGETTSKVVELSPKSFAKVFSNLADLDPERGHLLLRAVDCKGQDAPGVSFQLHLLNPEAVPFYGFLGDVSGAETVAGDSHGGFLNLDVPVPYVVKAYRRDTGECVSKRRVLVQKGFRTIVSPMRPGGCNDW